MQPAGDDVDLPGAVDLRGGPDHRLVRLAGRVPALERAQEAEAPGRAERPDALVEQRHPGQPGPRQLGGPAGRPAPEPGAADTPREARHGRLTRIQPWRGASARGGVRGRERIGVNAELLFLCSF